MNTSTSNPAHSKRALFWLLIPSASLLLLIPALLNSMYPISGNTPPTAIAKSVDPSFWCELNLVRQLVQNELNSFSNLPKQTFTTTLGQNARQHFRQAMSILPASTRTLPTLRAIRAEAENDFDLLQLEKSTIRQLAAQQLIQQIARAEQFIRGEQ